MKNGLFAGWLAIAAALLTWGSPASASETRQLWYVTTSLGFHTTEDEVRNNAAAAGDPRPGSDVTRAGVIDDGLSFSLNAGFGLTARLSLQLDTGWFRGDIGPADGYLSDQYPVSNPLNPLALTATAHHTAALPSMVGALTQIPVSVTLVTRFRKDMRLNPFLGAGAGMIFTDVEMDDELEALNERILRLRVREVFDENGRHLAPQDLVPLKAQGRLPPSHLVSLHADDAFEWHLQGGLEYFLGKRSSFVASLAYIFTDGAVEFLAAGEDQVTFWIFPEALFRADGSLRIFNDLGISPNPYKDPRDPAQGLVKCTPNTTGDFDGDGHFDDLCYSNSPVSPLDDPDGRLTIQGGRIEYDGFTINLGVRFYF